MKQKMILAIVGCTLLFWLGVGYGQTAVTVGGHYWYAQPDYKGDFYENVDISPGNMFGPYLNLRVGRIAIGSSMFFGSFNWDYPDFDYNFDINRQDMNFSLGVAVLPRFTIFGAIKNLKLSGEDEFSFIDDWGFSWNGRVSVENKGTLYGGGVSGVVPFSASPLFLFWSAAYLTGEMELSSSSYLDGQLLEELSEKGDVNITAVTVGLGYQTRSGLALMVGYRADFSGEDEGEERIHGVLATLAYTIR